MEKESKCLETDLQFETKVLKYLNHLKANHTGYISWGTTGESERVNAVLCKNGVIDYYAEERVAKSLPYLIKNTTAIISLRWMNRLREINSQYAKRGKY